MSDFIYYLFHLDIYPPDSQETDGGANTGFPKLLVHRYPLDTVADLNVSPKFCDVSLKKGFQLESLTYQPKKF